jgi:hypothetical protein
MAFLVKNQNRTYGTSTPISILDQFVLASQGPVILPATTTGQIFRVTGGRVLIRALVGEVTTAASATVTTIKVTSKKLSNANVAVGTAVDVAAAVAITSAEVGSLYFVEGDGTAGVVSTAGAAFIGTNSGLWIAPQGEIYLTTSATNTGVMKWDCWYQPLDAGAVVVPATLSAGLLQAAI